MGCCSQAAVALGSITRDPTLHVNYAKGMVLGVDDFQQEFAYLAGRDQWALRELAGYGTTSGLAVFVDASPDGPRIRVSAGSAVLPNGQLVCVPAEQCALPNNWLAKPENAKAIGAAIPPGSPPATKALLPLYLTLQYASCTTQPVPIPGDPCRSEGMLMAPSRVADDYTLALDTKAPAQSEEDAVRSFVAWLRRQLAPAGSPPATRDETALAMALAAAFKPFLDALASGKNLQTLAEFLAGSPPVTLPVQPSEMPEFVQAALRLWVTRLRPACMACHCGNACADAGLLLARLVIPVVRPGGSSGGVWEVDGTQDIVIDESRRPLLLQGRLLQQWQLTAVPL